MISLAIFSLCLTKIIRVIVIQIYIIIFSFLLIKKSNGDIANEINDDKELILKMQNMIIQIDKVITPINGSNEVTTPKPVATPLPPLKLSQTGKVWPITEKNPAKATTNNLYS